ncbi:MAG: hypothetical protein JKP90_16950 [Desulfofustis sp. PB-SRB1]|nr:hypothetical protein [Desulfofustis sp. PB-SRB1]
MAETSTRHMGSATCTWPVPSGLVNRQAVPRSASIILTESIIDAVTLYDQGFTNVIPAYGVNGVTRIILFSLTAR